MSEPIRILHVIGLMDRGGAETLIMNLYRNIDRSKVQFDFVENRAVEGAYDPEILSLGGRIFRCPHYNGKNHFSYVRWWHTFLKEHAPEYRAVHGHLGSTAAIYLGIAKKYGLYTIAHSHNTGSFSLYDQIYKIFAYPTRYVADFFFGCSAKAGADRYGKRIVNSSVYKTLPNAIDTNKFAYNHDTRKELRASMGLTDQIVIGHVGRFFQQKNHAFLIEIFSHIHKVNPNTRLLLVGDGELRDQIVKQISQLGLTDSVILTGVQSDVSKFYQAMDVFVFPSLYEGFGIVTIEAQASGLPCILSDSIPSDCIVTDLVSQLALDASADEWSREIQSKISIPRFDHSKQIAEHGFDIAETAKWLGSFYQSIGA